MLQKPNSPKLNYFRFNLLSWSEVAMLSIILDPWLFKLAVESPAPKTKRDLPQSPRVLIGVVDLELADLEAFIAPHIWDEIQKEGIAKVEIDTKAS